MYSLTIYEHAYLSRVGKFTTPIIKHIAFRHNYATLVVKFIAFEHIRADDRGGDLNKNHSAERNEMDLPTKCRP